MNTPVEQTSIAASMTMTASHRILRSGEDAACFLGLFFVVVAVVFVIRGFSPFFLKCPTVYYTRVFLRFDVNKNSSLSKLSELLQIQTG